MGAIVSLRHQTLANPCYSMKNSFSGMRFYSSHTQFRSHIGRFIDINQKHSAPSTSTFLRGLSSSADNGAMDLNLAGMRAKYNDEHSNFTEDKLSSLNPFLQFKQWMEEASQNPKIEESNAMCISTVSPSGRPSSRMVLLKGFSEDTGFRFFTNYTSRKASELLANPHVSLMFYWEPLHRSVRVEGVAAKIPSKDSDDYFHSRPVTSQIGSIVSDQSTPIESRGVLNKKNAELEALYLPKDGEAESKEI